MEEPAVRRRKGKKKKKNMENTCERLWVDRGEG